MVLTTIILAVAPCLLFNFLVIQSPFFSRRIEHFEITTEKVILDGRESGGLLNQAIIIILSCGSKGQSKPRCWPVSQSRAEH